MASISAFSSLAPPATEDTMEMSSPAQRPDDDIDIDFGDYPDGGQIEDDQMIEDAQTRPGTGTDDMMEDDTLPVEQAVVQEEVMQDGDVHDVAHVEDDDELIDYGDEEYQDAPHDETIIASESEQANQAIANHPETVESELTQGAVGTVLAHASSPTEILPPSSVIGEEVVYDESGADASHASEGAQSTSFNAGGAGRLTEERQEEQRLETVVETEEDTEDNTPGTPTDTGLHPMMIRYGDLHIPLFKSRRQPDGLLKDDNLASLSLAELMKNCRQRLAIKIGEDLSEDQEIHLGFDRLGLLLVEDSRVAFESSLNDILEVYLQLQRNDGLDEIPPLSLTLSLQLRFASSLSILKQAAAGGQGMSTFGFLNMTEDDESYQEQYEYGETTEFARNEDEEETYEQTGTDTVDGDYPGHEGGIEEHQAHNGIEEAHGEAEEPNYHDDLAYHQEELVGEGVDEPPPGIEDILHSEQQSTHELYNAPDDPVENYEQQKEAGSAPQGDSAEQYPGQENSNVGSTSAEGNPEVDDTGEYDFIDWDDDSLTSDLSVPDSADQEEFSTYPAELAGEDAAGEAIAQNVEQILGGGAATEQDTSIPADEHTVAIDGQQHVSSEEFQHDLGEHDYDGQGQYQEQEDETHEPSRDYGENEEEEIDQADPDDEQQEQYHLDYEPGTNDEQFHTTQDFLNGEFYEHGPEHDVYYDGEEGLDDSIETVVHHALDEGEEDQAQDDYEGDFDFDEATEPVDANALHHSTTGSLSVKRSFDDFDEQADSHFGDEDRETKKARAG